MIVETRDRAALEEFLRRDAALHFYELGDLDPRFAPRCRWHALCRDGEFAAVVLEYACPLLHTVLALGRDDDGAVAELFAGVLPSLPARFYAHLSPGLEALLGGRKRSAHGVHLKMLLHDAAALEAERGDGVDPLTPADLPALRALFARAYPGNWFDPIMLESDRYFGIREAGRLVAVAGVHVYSRALSVAALGNIATDPSCRGRGLARRVTARLCRELRGEVDLIGLHVDADNAAAVACYRRLGFVEAARYREWLVEDG